MLIAAAYSGHDCSYVVLKDGIPLIHDELERFTREKEPHGDGIQFLIDNFDKHEEIKHFATVYPVSKTLDYPSFEIVKKNVENNKGNIYAIGHHQAHAANAFFSSNLKESLVITLDGGGIEQNHATTAATIWLGKENKIFHVKTFQINEVNFGGIWTKSTRYIFGLSDGWPYGHQAGTVMAMAALGDREKYREDFIRMLTVDNAISTIKPKDEPRVNNGTDPEHPYLNKWKLIADSSEQAKYDVAAGLQAATEEVLHNYLSNVLSSFDYENICISGGVSLNCVAMGKIKTWFPKIKNIYIPPTPHDGGLTIGAAQYVWHHELDNPRITWEDNFTPYLGQTYDKESILKCLSENKKSVTYSACNQKDVLKLMNDQKIISVFGGGSESGRRALGNRSILADPRKIGMKDLINEKVKHRQHFRPFAPAMIREDVEEWFERDDDSPYMNIVLKFKEDKKALVPAVVHFDDTARVQTVTELDNPWFYSFLKEWKALSGVPIILNTSFNDREPICETPTHAVNCFLRTNIDYLYFYDYNILVEKI